MYWRSHAHFSNSQIPMYPIWIISTMTYSYDNWTVLGHMKTYGNGNRTVCMGCTCKWFLAQNGVESHRFTSTHANLCNENLHSMRPHVYTVAELQVCCIVSRECCKLGCSNLIRKLLKRNKKMGEWERVRIWGHGIFDIANRVPIHSAFIVGSINVQTKIKIP